MAVGGAFYVKTRWMSMPGTLRADEREEILLHGKRVAMMAADIYEKLPFSLSNELGPLATVMDGAIYHDVGKARIPSAILNKAGYLTEEEWTLMRQHPILGMQDYLAASRDSGVDAVHRDRVAQLILRHHERKDGSGYYGFLEDDPGVWFIGMLDMYTAMREVRVYRQEPMSKESIVTQLAATYPEAFLRHLKPYLPS